MSIAILLFVCSYRPEPDERFAVLKQSLEGSVSNPSVIGSQDTLDIKWDIGAHKPPALAYSHMTADLAKIVHAASESGFEGELIIRGYMGDEQVIEAYFPVVPTPSTNMLLMANYVNKESWLTP